MGQPAYSQHTTTELTPFSTRQTENGRTITFTQIDTVLADQETIPTTGWMRDRLDRIRWYVSLGGNFKKVHSQWGRVRFDRTAIGDGPIAIYTQDNREQIKLFVNGVEVFRNYAKREDKILGWYRPYIVPLSPEALQDGVNEIVIQSSSYSLVAVGRLQIGAQQDLQKHYDYIHLVRITGPIVANCAMVFLGLCALLMWFARRGETELLFFALTATMWMVRDYHFFAPSLPFDAETFYGITVYSLYFAAAASASFCLIFLRIPGRNTIIPIMFGFGLTICTIHAIFRISEIFVYLPTFVIAMMTSFLGFRDLRKTTSAEHLFLSIVMASLTFTSIHDFGRNEELWQGLGFFIQPYIGFTFTSAFLFAFGKRSLVAFKALGGLNRSLETGIAEARAELATSEAERSALEIERAIVLERERLMREMHDGIGSNLVTALAVAERQHQPQSTIKTLKRAISDLKITVDSLEPIAGDLPALIANLRHRMRLDLRAAGLTSKWEVGNCEPIVWLDATNALHVLRIFQEAISNVIAHSGASIMRIGCLEETRNGIAGIATYVSDNGHGFSLSTHQDGGRGLANMRSRAATLGGQISIESAIGEGTKLNVWLPYQRAA